MPKFFESIAELKNYLSFTLSLICVLGALAAHFMKGTPIEGLLPMLLGLYLGSRTTEKVMNVRAAAMDPGASTLDAINAVSNHKD